MRVLITGGTGAVGKAVTRRLVEHGWDVRVIGIEPEADTGKADYRRCDIMNYADVREQMRGCEVVVHLAAIPNPVIAPGQDVFAVNAAGTFNVFEAAAAEGIRRVVQASSINALGCAWSPNEIAPCYFPIDEEHPTFTTDPYSFSKNVVEDIGAYYWRRDGISSVALRLPGVWAAGRAASEEMQKRRDLMRAELDKLARQSNDERSARMDEARKQALEMRHQRRLEYPGNYSAAISSLPDLITKVYAFDRFNFWAFIDDRDSAQAMEKGLTAEYEGAHALFVNADHNWVGYDSEALARLFFPQVDEWKRPVEGSETLVSIDKARALIGFEPEFGGGE